jgi:hypothetical protein
MHLLANRACNPDLLYRTGRPDREHRWVPGKTWARSTDRFSRQLETASAGSEVRPRPRPPTLRPQLVKAGDGGAKEHSSSLHAGSVSHEVGQEEQFSRYYGRQTPPVLRS